METIFGLDLGTTSIGWAVISTDSKGRNGSILGMGVRVFPEARDPDGTPLNQQRRLSRQMRRQVRRRRERRRQLNELLSGAGLLPSYSSADWASAMALDPYAGRRDGLQRALKSHELGRALYHLAKRRHFRGRDLEEAEQAESADEKEAKSEREKLVKALKVSGATLGAYLAGLPQGIRKRGRHALRDNVRDEFNALVSHQAAHHAILNDRNFLARLDDTIFAQRPVFWRKNTLGDCRLMPGEDLAPKASWLSCQRRMLEKLNNLEIAGGNRRPLEEAERAAILGQLQAQASMSWAGVRKALEPIFRARGESARKVRFNLEEGGALKLDGNWIESRLAKMFGDAWSQHPHKDAIREAVSTRLRASDYGEIGQRITILRETERKSRRCVAAASFARDFDVGDEQVAQLEAMTFPTGWDAFSSEAIKRFLPELERGEKLGTLLASPEWHDWRNEMFPSRQQPTGEVIDYLPSPRDKTEAARLRAVRNPTVVRVLNEMRKVVNNLVRIHGKPDLIRIEVAREVGLSKTERDEKSKAMRDQEKRRKTAVADLKANGIAEPARRDIEKWLLWKEAKERDPYSGDHVSFDALFRNNEFEVEHIWPRSKSLDDSFGNKTLCRRDLNLLKGDRLPYEAFGYDEDLWSAIRLRVEEMTSFKGGAGISRGKAKRFLATAIPDDFASRQLNDTGYAAKQALSSLQRLWPDIGPKAPVNVQAVSGKVTAYSRRLWELNNILSKDGEKTRADHRHHAVDALVVACAEPRVIQLLSRYWQQKDSVAGEVQRPVFEQPWPTIRADAARTCARIVVSHRVRKKVSGPLHEGTIHGDTGLDEINGKEVSRFFTVRKPVESLSNERIGDIRDEAVRRIVREWVEARGGDPKKAFPPFPRMSPDGPEIRKARILVKRQFTLMGKATTGYAELGSNHHVAIFKNPNGKIEFEVVSLYEAARRLAAREPIVRRVRDGAEFLMSLAPGDMLQFPPEHPKAGFRKVEGVWASGVVVTVAHDDAAGTTKWRPSASVLPGMGARKVAVDPLGIVRRASD